MNHSEQSMLISVDPDDFSFICGCAVRYALGRKTYSVSIVTEFILTHMEQLDTRTKTTMIRDIEMQKAFSADAYGDECDKELWSNLLECLKKHLPEV